MSAIIINIIFRFFLTHKKKSQYRLGHERGWSTWLKNTTCRVNIHVKLSTVLLKIIYTVTDTINVHNVYFRSDWNNHYVLNL